MKSGPGFAYVRMRLKIENLEFEAPSCTTDQNLSRTPIDAIGRAQTIKESNFLKLKRIHDVFENDLTFLHNP
jgi:hypothetical protein